MRKHLFCEYEIFSTDLAGGNVDIDQILSELFCHKKDYSYSHFIQKRWENIYVNPMLIPALLPVFSLAVFFTKKAYNKKIIVPHELLGFKHNEFWFNIAKPGESTGVHNHKDKSTLSGVFYLQVPEKSGHLIFKNGKSHKLEFQVETGQMVLFPSSLNHYVSENRSDSERISLAFNCFTFPLMENPVEFGYEKSKYFG